MGRRGLEEEPQDFLPFAIQRRLQFSGVQVIILPIRVWETQRAA